MTAVILVCLFRTTHATACPSAPQYTHLHEAQLNIYTADTSCAQPTRSASIPVCYVDALNQLLTEAISVLQEAFNEMVRRDLLYVWA